MSCRKHVVSLEQNMQLSGPVCHAINKQSTSCFPISVHEIITFMLRLNKSWTSRSFSDILRAFKRRKTIINFRFSNSKVTVKCFGIQNWFIRGQEFVGRCDYIMWFSGDGGSFNTINEMWFAHNLEKNYSSKTKSSK